MHINWPFQSNWTKHILGPRWNLKYWNMIQNLEYKHIYLCELNPVQWIIPGSTLHSGSKFVGFRVALSCYECWKAFGFHGVSIEPGFGSLKMDSFLCKYIHELSNIQSNLQETCLLTFSLCLTTCPPPTKQNCWLTEFLRRFKNKLQDVFFSLSLPLNVLGTKKLI